MSIEINLFRSFTNIAATRARGSVTVNLYVIKTDPDDPAAGRFELSTGYENFQLAPGANTVVFDYTIPPDARDDTMFGFGVLCVESNNVAYAWASLTITQCDYLLENSGTVDTTALTMTPILVHGVSNGGGGGFYIDKTGDLASVAAIEIVGYYEGWDATPLQGASAFYAPAISDAYLTLDTPITLPPEHYDAPTNGHPANWDGWIVSTIESIDQGVLLAKVALDGGTPVFAVLSNQSGY